MKIFRYPLTVADEQKVEMPEGATILCCQIQFDEPCLWAVVDPDVPVEPRTILMVGTGHDVTFDPVATRYIGTIQQLNGSLVWHVFEPTSKVG